jgi:hypothetical protein
MSTSTLHAAIIDIMTSDVPPEKALAQHEKDIGFVPVTLGVFPFFDVADWHPATLVSMRGKTWRLVLLHAKNPGTGALTRLLIGIKAHDPHARIQIIDPTREMQITLRRKGWKGRETGSTFQDRKHVWELPRKGAKP